MVTIRDRDTMKQERVAIDALHGMIAQKVSLSRLLNPA
jgi:glycyl-tRNA synthetase (class II)